MVEVPESLEIQEVIAGPDLEVTLLITTMMVSEKLLSVSWNEFGLGKMTSELYSLTENKL